jgi:hypothetical protein
MLRRNLPDIPLDVPSYDESDCAFDLTSKGAAHNETAHGPKRKPSYFTQALLKALHGGAAVRHGSTWVVETGQIAVALNQLLGLMKSSESYRQRCVSIVSETREIIRLTEAPDVHLTLGCSPTEANALAQLSCVDVTGARYERAPNAAPWTLIVKAGICQVLAQFNRGPYHSAPQMVSALPPTTDADGALLCQR